ncbi:MAG: hypothetical protein WCZ65_06165 [Lysobacteraceae bacterium]
MKPAPLHASPLCHRRTQRWRRIGCGAASRVSAVAITRTYAYNKRRLPTSESVSIDGNLFVIGYQHDALGHLNQQHDRLE